MKKEPSEQMWTKIDAFMLRAVEKEPTLAPESLGRRVGNRHGYYLTEKEVLTRLNIYKDADNSLFNPNPN